MHASGTAFVTTFRAEFLMFRWLLLLMIAASYLLLGQSFEVASVKPTSAGAGVRTDPSRMDISGTMSYMLRWAYGLKEYQVSGPELIHTAAYLISAKTSAPTSLPDLKLMLQKLLAERFKLTFHRETREFAVYALVVAKGGPKLKESDTEGDAVTKNNAKPGTGGTSLRTTMAQLGDTLAGVCPEPVVDLTGLKGRYDFTLDFSDYLVGVQPGDIPNILNQAMQKQIGIGLEHRKTPIEVLIVDHMEKAPLEN
jgi:uncharacterized protein (TIGR03435 family)